MPELPEVTTTVHGLNTVLPSLTITDVWSDYFLRTRSTSKNTIKNKKFFQYFKKEIIGEKVSTIDRRGKNILVRMKHGKTILIHMKMTGHLLYGTYNFEKNVWHSDEPFLRDSFNQFIHLVFVLSNGKHLAFSDMRKFAKVTLFETNKEHTMLDIQALGPEPLEYLSLPAFRTQLQKKPKGKIKTVLMDQTIFAGIGNIYSDEILWKAGIHPERMVSSLSNIEHEKIYTAMLFILKKSIKMGGDSMSDYRNIYGQKGSFQLAHKAYRRTGEKCERPKCSGTIRRKIVGGRSTHFCDIHQTV